MEGGVLLLRGGRGGGVVFSSVLHFALFTLTFMALFCKGVRGGGIRWSGV